MQTEATPIFHKAVLINEVVTYLNPQPHGVYVDATFGGGGHTMALLEAEPTCRVVAIDWDTQAIDQNAMTLQEKYGERFTILWGNFAHIAKLLKKEGLSTIHGILADFGTSQFQIHQRPGFSFQTDTPLDMRMSPSHQQITAADILNKSSELELATIFGEYGEEPRAGQIARAVIAKRAITPFATTGQLVDLIHSIINPRSFKAQRSIDPATKVFQALRIVVNRELENIHALMTTGLRLLSPGGRMVCISFHSLEDRLVKNFFRDHPSELEILTPKPIIASLNEQAENPSSRSAKLRAATKR